MSEDLTKKGKLFIVSVPIGNIEDISYRAVRILKEVDLIAAEDTRRAKRLLNEYAIHTNLTSYYSYNEKKKGDLLLDKMDKGLRIALISDSGSPGISDPSYYIIKRSLECNINIYPIPGPSAVIAGLMVSGFRIDRFIFEGFLPKKKGKREKRLKMLLGETRACIIFESPHRIQKTLKEIHTYLGNRNIVLAREVTKTYEEMIRGNIEKVIDEVEKRKKLGEITLIIEGEEKKPRVKERLYSQPDNDIL